MTLAFDRGRRQPPNLFKPALEEVEHRLRRLRAQKTYLRAGDAIHLTSAKREGFKVIWSNDRHLVAAAKQFGLRGRSV